MPAIAIISLISAIATALPGLIQAVESIFGATKGNGAVKKEMVQQTVGTVLQVMAATGNDDVKKPEVAQAIMDGTGAMIDGLVGSFNAVHAWANPKTTGSDR